MFGKELKQISSGRANTDIQKVLCTIKSQLWSTYKDQHVAAHQDEYTRYENLELETKLNCKCNKMAKEAIDDFIDGKGAYKAYPQSLSPWHCH